jgi:hypothetical protein
MKRLRGLFAPLLEKRCAACADPITLLAATGPNEDHLPICAACSEKLQRRSGGYCPACGNLTALSASAPTLCGACLARRGAGKSQP